jgi:hypothetical protein
MMAAEGRGGREDFVLAGMEEERAMAAMKRGRTTSEINREIGLGDFGLCQCKPA